MVLVIDSSQFYQHLSLNSKEMALIKALGNRHLVDLYIPWFVFKECTSKSISEMEGDLSKVMNTLQAIERKGIDNPERREISSIIREVDEFRSKIRTSNTKLWEEFIYFSRAEIMPFEEKDSVTVFSAYFNGERPFSKVKSREDIPDAFIFNSVLRLVEDISGNTENVVHFVSSDKNLLSAFEGQANLITYDSLTSIFESKPLRTLVEDYLRLDPVTEEVRESLFQAFLGRKLQFKANIKRYFRDWLPAKVYDFQMPENYTDVTITKIADWDVSFERRDFAIVGESIYNRLKVTGLSTIVFNVWRSDWESLGHRPDILEQNEYFYRCTETRNVVLFASIFNFIQEIYEKDIDVAIDGFEDIEFE